MTVLSVKPKSQTKKGRSVASPAWINHKQKGTIIMSIRIETLTIERPIDTDPDMSYLEDPTVQGQEYFDDNQKRLSEFGETWWMFGLYARAQVSYDTGQGGKRLEYLQSGGLWGIESDIGMDHFIEVSNEELELGLCLPACYIHELVLTSL